jgi:iron complex outermembrane receptor protein
MSARLSALDLARRSVRARALPFVLIPLATLLVVQNALAQSGTATEMPAVVVSGSRFAEPRNQVPADVRVITREQIEASAATNMAEVLAQLGGLNVSGPALGQLGLGASVDLGGFGSTANSTTLVLLDGRRLNPADSLGVAWESVPLGRIERIEILQGGASVQYGNGAVGGVINIITRGTGAPVNEVSGTLGAFGTAMGSARLGLQHEQRSLQLDLDTARTDGWRENSATDTWALNGRFTQAGSGTDRLWLDLSASHSQAGNPGGVVGQVGSGDARAAKFNNIGASTSGDHGGLQLGLARSLGEVLAFEGEAGWTERTIRYRAPYFATDDSVGSGWPSGPVRTAIDSREATLTPRIKADWGRGNQLVMGYDLARTEARGSDGFGPQAEAIILANQGGGYYNNLLADAQRASITAQSAYLISRVALDTQLELSGGLRRQVNTTRARDTNISSPDGTVDSHKTFAANAADLALNRSWGTGHRAWLKWNQSFRFANIDEYWGWDPDPPWGRKFASILKPQVSRTWETGASTRSGSLRLDGSIFQSVTRDEIRYDPTTGSNLNSAGEVTRRGLRTEVGYRLTDSLEASAGARLQRSTFSSGENIGHTVSLVPNTTLRAGITWTLARQWTAGGTVRHVGRQYYDGDSTNALARMPSYTTADLYARWRSGAWDVRLLLKNATGTHYATYGGYSSSVLQPGGTLGTSYYYYPSDPRSLMLSARYRF